MKLTRTQERVMEWLHGGHVARRQYGAVVYVNGGKLCTAATMLALEYRGLVRRVSNDEWIATRRAVATRTDGDYIAFDPFSEDRDVDIQCHKVSIVTTRKEHWCSAGCLIGNDHNIPAGQRARRERARVDGQFGTCYQCLPCLDKLMEMNQ